MSTAAVASAASGIARRSRIRGLDGLARRRSFHGTPPVSPPETPAPAGSAAAALAPNRPLARCRSLTSAPSTTGGGGGRRSYTSAARVTSAARRGGDWSDDSFVWADGINFGGQFLAGAVAVAGALVATSSGGGRDLDNDRVGGDITSWGNDRAGGGGGGGRGGVRCDASAAAVSRHQHVASAESSSFREACSTDSQNNKSGAMLSRSSSSSSSCCGSEVMQVGARALSCLEPSAVAPAARSPAPSITDVYFFEGAAEPVIGRGQRSVVSTARHRLTGQPVAVKRLARAETTRLEVMEEVQMLKVAGKHPNVVTMQAFFEDQEAYYIVMEMCEGGELFHRLADKGRYSEGQAARIMAEVASAVGFLHRNGIVHFDLKPENIMLAVGGDDCVPEVRLADFGSAFRQYRQISSARDYTAAYSAPEVLSRQSVDDYRQVDMWALGVVMWVLLTGEHPFGAHSDLSEAELARRVAEMEPDLKALRHVSPEAKDLVRRLLARDPEDRPSALQLLSHPWLRAVVTTHRSSLRRPQSLVRRRHQQQQVEGESWGVRPPRHGVGDAERKQEGGEGVQQPCVFFGGCGGGGHRTINGLEWFGTICSAPLRGGGYGAPGGGGGGGASTGFNGSVHCRVPEAPRGGYGGASNDSFLELLTPAGWRGNKVWVCK
ncbi:unnamed protein product [Ectocarpus sp. CCAP 1310/34]|nr:unnamed protein product [Ectocarpus sp. CCAP 1310/34]